MMAHGINSVQNPQPVNAMPAQNILSQMPPVPIPARNNNAPPVYPPVSMNPYQLPIRDDNGKAKLYGIIVVIAIIAGIIGGLISGGIVSSVNHIDSNVSRSFSDFMMNHDSMPSTPGTNGNNSEKGLPVRVQPQSIGNNPMDKQNDSNENSNDNNNDVGFIPLTVK